MMKRVLFGIAAWIACVISVQAQTQVIAHRGYWKAEGSAQNSIASLEKAAEIQVYGSEFDVLMTGDGKLVVNHDSSIEGMKIEDTPYKNLRTLRIKNGEQIPTLKSYLKRGKRLDIQLILEIKPLSTPEKELRATDKIVKMVKRMHLEKQVEYISFSLNVCERLAELTPKSEIAYLNGDIAPSELKAKGINGIDYRHNVIIQHPEWVEEAHREGMKVNVWTVNEEEMIKQFINLKVDYITTDHPVEVKNLVEFYH